MQQASNCSCFLIGPKTATMNADFQEVTKGVFHPMAQETISLKLLPREVLGKQVRRLRRDGLVPAVIHDHGKPSVHVQADYNSIAKV
jgi:hypothetical protein